MKNLGFDEEKGKGKVKARPSVRRRKEEEEKLVKEKKYVNPKYKFLHMWIDKLENMQVILTAEEGMCKHYKKVISYEFRNWSIG